jgi:hypothetical protein
MAEPPNVLLTTRQMKARVCPACGARHDSFTHIAQPNEMKAKAPRPGNLTICDGCSTLLVFTETGFRLANDAEIAAKKADPFFMMIWRNHMMRTATKARKI